MAVRLVFCALVILCALGWVGGGSVAGASEVLRDDFEGPGLSAIWYDKTAPANRVSFREGSKAGKRALSLSVRASDFDKNCECQRTEIREAEDAQPEFGSDIWYRFRLRIPELKGELENSRWMLGAWKQEVEGSPFLALRFEGGVFYITLESSQTRVMLASSLIDAGAFIQILKGGQGERFGFVSDQQLYFGPSRVVLKHGTAVYLPDPRFEWVDLTVRIKGSLEGEGIVEIYANDRFVVRATGKIGVDSPSGSKTHFRVGHRRDRTGSDAILLIDDYRRGPTRASVAN